MDDSDSDLDVFSPTRRKTTDEPNAAAASAAAKEAGSPSPPKGSGAQLQASSPRGRPGTSKNRKNAKGKTIVEVTAYEKFDSNREYCGMVEKTAKYSGQWVPRFIRLQDIDLEYGMAEGQKPKDIIRIHKVTRGAELGRDKLSIVVEGMSNKDRKQLEFTFRCKDEEETELWWLRIAHCLTAGNQMDMPRDNMPLAHPRTGLKFVNIPLEHLATFAPLDRLVLHFFSPATHRHPSTGTLGRMIESKACVFVGDLCVYVCDQKANITRCVAIALLKGILTVGGNAETWTVGLQCALPEYDILFNMEAKAAEQLVSVLTDLHAHFGVSKAAKDEKEVGLKRQKLAKEGLLLPQMSLDAPEGYELKIRLPMSKRYLLKMVADGEKGGTLTVTKVVRHLGIQMAEGKGATGDSNGAAKGDGAAKASADANGKDGAKGKSGAANGADDGVTSNPLAQLGATSQGGANAKNEPGKPPPPPDSDSDDSVHAFMQRRANASGTGPGNKPPPPAFSDSDSDGPIQAKASPLANKFGSGPDVAKGAAGPSPPTTSSGGIQIAMGVDRMHRLLNTVGLPQYYAVLTERGVDWEIFSCMDTLDLKKFGVANVEHQIKIENALNDPALMEALRRDGGGSGSAMPSMPPPPPTSGAAVTNGGAPPPPPGPPKAPMFIDDDDL